MSSHLTRLVFRSIIADQPLTYRGCRLRAARPHIVARRTRGIPHVQRRTFMDLFKQRRKAKPMEMPAGLLVMSEVSHSLDTGVRPPQPKAVTEALKTFFTQRKGAFEQFHVTKALISFQYLLDNPREDGQPWLSAQELLADIYGPLLHIAHRPESDMDTHIKFGKLLLDECSRQLDGSPADESKVPQPAHDLFLKRIQLLSAFGGAVEARDLAARASESHSDLSVEQLQVQRDVWGMVLNGLSQEEGVEEMRKATDLIQSLSIPVTAKMQHSLVTFFCGRKELQDAKFWYDYPLVNGFGKKGGKPTPRTYAVLLKACAMSGDLSFGHELVASLLKTEMPEKGAWDAVFLWSAAIGKGVDEVDRMMNVMIRRNDEARQKNPAIELIRPDIETLNALVELAISRQDPYSAERYIALGEKRGIIPDEKTYAMQIQYRVSVKDLDGARAAYYNLQGEFSGAEQSVKAVNSLIRALCENQQHHFDEMMVMVDDLHERKAHFAPQTIAALCVLHLRRGEAHDAIDLLQVHAHQYSPEQRAHIQKGLLSFTLDPGTSTAEAWESYQVMRRVFSETPREDRLKVMDEFFSRKRSDMACHVFFHMRNHVTPELCANRDVYVAAFAGFARCADAESLELAHNQLKLDFSVDLDTRLRNALMLAYGSTDQSTKALRFWREICESKEGPSYNSIAIAFRACESMHHGYGHARSIWKRLKEQDVEIDKTIWKAYMCAMASNFQHDEAQAMIETVEEEYGFPLDLDILGNWFNCTLTSERQRIVEAWIKERYPDIWDQLEALGHWVTMDGFGYRQYYINRNLDP
ncbi:hypothetical protein DE146DRAFT_343320 [Phaeosphaeria sp. MPI-PUGE-AT-0046c]|nr:hypothetical protein DE146DRAFT_343320 [Phaeosphaeria sp. MPI-PUGE-AT-0046c]